MKDLLILAADQDAEFAIESLLKRLQLVSIRAITCDIQRHINRDNGCFSQGPEFLRNFQNQYRYALLIFDKHGSGRDNRTIEEIESAIQIRLDQYGWNGRSRTIILDPELEILIWVDSRELVRILRWNGDYLSMVSWLKSKNLWQENVLKPADPKRAMEAVLKETRTGKSASLFKQIASSVSLNRCEDNSLHKLKNILQEWFPLQDSE